MNPRVKQVTSNNDYTLLLKFTNGELRKFDMKPYLDIGIFAELKELKLFKTAKATLGTVSWKNGQDLCPDTFYLESIPMQKSSMPKTQYSKTK